MTAFHPTPQSFIKNQQKQQQLPRKGYSTWISLGDEETNMKQDESVQLRGHNIRNTMLPCTVTKRTNRLHNLVRTAPKINAFSPNKAGKPLRKHLISTKLLSTRRLTDHDESMNRPLLTLTTSFDSTKVNATIISIGGPLDTCFERIDKERKGCPVASDRVGNEGDNEIYRTACSTGTDIPSQRRSRSINRHHLDFFEISQEISPIGQAVVPWKTYLKSDIVHIPSLKVPQRDPMIEISCKKTYKAVEVTPRNQFKTIDPEMDSQKVSKTERKQKKLRRFLKVPEGFAAQINVMTGLVDLLCVDPSQTAPKVEFIPELTRCTQLCIPMSATALISPRSFPDLEVRSVQMRNSAA